jgi:Tfp pilus assembly protein PilV
MSKTKSATRNIPAAFTLTEVIVASLLLAVAMVPILKALSGAHRLDTKIERRTRSLQLAQAKLEDIRAKSVYTYDTNFNDASSAVDVAYIGKVVDTPVTAELRKIQVSVGYDDNTNSVLDGDEVEVTVETLLAKRW